MYGLPKNFDGTFFIGRTLEMICFAQYQVFLHFDENIIITIESSFSYKNDLIVAVPAQESNLMVLIGKTVSTVSTENSGTLCLIFDDGEILKVYDSFQKYESYRITYNGCDIIV